MNFSVKSCAVTCIKSLVFVSIFVIGACAHAQSFINLAAHNTKQLYAGVEDNNHFIAGFLANKKTGINLRHTLLLEKPSVQFVQADIGYKLALTKHFFINPRIYGLTNYGFNRKVLMINADVQYSFSKVELAANFFGVKSDLFDKVKYYEQFGLNVNASKEVKLQAWYGPRMNFGLFTQGFNIGTVLSSGKLFGRAFLNVPEKNGAKYSSVNTSVCYTFF